MAPRQSDSGRSSRFLSQAAPWIALVAAPCILLSPILAGQCLVPGAYQRALLPWGEPLPAGLSWNPLMLDAVLQYYPWRWFAAESLRSGEIPLWNPHQLCGMPFLANGQSAVLYPPNGIFWLLPVKYAFGVGALLHVILAGVLTYGFARVGLGLSRSGGTLAGLAYQLCGFFVAWTPMTAAMNTLAWLPGPLLGTAWFLAKPGSLRAAGLALTVAMLLLAGHLQSAYYGMLLGLGYGAVRILSRRQGQRRSSATAWVLGSLTLGLALAAGQILPTMELAAVNHRSAEKSAAALEFLRAWSLAGEFGPMVAGLFTMAPFGNPSQGTWLWYPQNYAEVCGVVGGATVLLAFSGFSCRLTTDQKFLLFVAAGAALIALGTPLATLAYWALPGFSRFAGLPRILCLWCLAMALLGGIGLDRLADAREDPKLRLRVLSLVGLALVLIAAATTVSVRSLVTRMPAARDVILPDLAVFCLVLVVSVLGIAASFRGADRRLFVGIVAAELLFAGYGYNLTSAPEGLLAEVPALQHARDQTLGLRVAALTRHWGFTEAKGAVLPPNTGTVFGLRDVQGYDSLMPLWAKAGAATMDPTPWPVINGNMVLLGEGDLADLQCEAMAERGVGLVLADHDTATQLVRQGDFHPVEASATIALLAPNWPPAPIPEIHGPNRFRSGPLPADLEPLVRETYAPGWRLRDRSGRSVPYELDARTGFMRVEPEEARQLILGSYEPGSFAVGAFLSFVALGALGAAFGWTFGLRPRRGAR